MEACRVLIRYLNGNILLLIISVQLYQLDNTWPCSKSSYKEENAYCHMGTRSKAGIDDDYKYIFLIA